MSKERVSTPSIARILDGFSVTAENGPTVAVQTCLEHLQLLGATLASPNRADKENTPRGRVSLRWNEPQQTRGVGDQDLSVAMTECDLSWFGTVDSGRIGSEATLQAYSGTMEVHGRSRGFGPRRLGLQLGSVASGILATQALLASVWARRRGRQFRTETSVLQGNLMFLRHHLAYATAPSDWIMPGQGPEPGPPYTTVDGFIIELECLDRSGWTRFWLELGMKRQSILQSWESFWQRYHLGYCRLSRGFEEAVRRHTLDELLALSRTCRKLWLCVVQPQRDPTLDRVETYWHMEPASVKPAAWRPPAAARESDLPLVGLKVIDATNRIQGPLASLLLSFLGAEVTRVEPPGGDLARLLQPAIGDVGAFFLAYNHGKKPVIEANLKTREGQAIVMDLVTQADVFLHNFRPGTMNKFGLSFEETSVRNPSLIYAQASAWGELEDIRSTTSIGYGTDYMLQAETGLGSLTSPEDEPPGVTKLPVTDVIGALLCAEGVLASLVQRDRTGGRGALVEVSLFTAAAAVQRPVERLMREQGRMEAMRTFRFKWTTLDRPLATLDGFIVISVTDNRSLQSVCNALQIERHEHLRILEQVIADRLLTASSAHWEQTFRTASVPVAVVREDIATMAEDADCQPLLQQVSCAWIPATPWRIAMTNEAPDASLKQPPRIDTPENWDAASQGYAEKIAPVLMEAFADEFTDQLDMERGMDVLEVASGSGALTLSLARNVDSLLATDFSPRMVSILTSKVESEGLDHVTCRIMDGMDLELNDNCMDRVACSFGLMLFPDRDRGFRELVRVLRPGGKALVSGWAGPKKFEALGLFVAAIEKVFPERPPPDTPPPVFSLSDVGRFEREMELAGFRNVQVGYVSRTLILNSFNELWSILTVGAPPVRQLFERVGQAGEKKIHDALAEIVMDRFASGPITLVNVATVGVGES